MKAIVTSIISLGAVCVVQADTVTLELRSGIAGNGSTIINVGRSSTEVETPYHQTTVGESWGGAGLNIGGSAVTFINGAMTGYSGTVYNASSTSSPLLWSDGNGMGIDTLTDSLEKKFMLDGQEAFSWTADKELTLEGFVLRKWESTGGRQLIISSSDWIGLTSVVPDTGIYYNSGAGAFTITEEAGNPVAALDTVTAANLVGDSGPALDFLAGGFHFMTDGVSQVMAIETITFSAIPEPATIGLVGLAASAVMFIRRFRI